MSYAAMDHAAWVEESIAACRSDYPPKLKRGPDGEPRGWGAAPDKLSPFQARVFDILGMVGGGIYNAPIDWDLVYWDRGGGVSIPWRGHAGLATFDFDRLTRLVFLCHDARIRCDVMPYRTVGFMLTFHPRSHEGGWSDRHPSLDEAVGLHRAYLPAEHRILYRPERDDPLPAKKEQAARRRAKEAEDRAVTMSLAEPVG